MRVRVRRERERVCRRVEQVRFGKLAFLLQNGASFCQKLVILAVLRHVLNEKPGNAYFCSTTWRWVSAVSHYGFSEKPGNAYFCSVISPFLYAKGSPEKNIPFFRCKLSFVLQRIRVLLSKMVIF